MAGTSLEVLGARHNSTERVESRGGMERREHKHSEGTSAYSKVIAYASKLAVS